MPPPGRRLYRCWGHGDSPRLADWAGMQGSPSGGTVRAGVHGGANRRQRTAHARKGRRQRRDPCSVGLIRSACWTRPRAKEAAVKPFGAVFPGAKLVEDFACYVSPMVELSDDQMRFPLTHMIHCGVWCPQVGCPRAGAARVGAPMADHVGGHARAADQFLERKPA